MTNQDKNRSACSEFQTLSRRGFLGGASLATAGVRAVVCGRALYERNFTLKEALARC